MKLKTVLLWLAASASVLPSAALADRLDALYTTQAVVTGTGETNRQPGFEACFRDVLVKVSGDQRVLTDPKVRAELPVSGGYVASFRYRDRLEGIPIHDEQGTHDRPHDLYCMFDRARVDAFLSEVGRKPWLGERPRITVLLAVSRAGKRFVLTRDGDDSPYMRDSLLAAAEPLALTVDVPSSAVSRAHALTVDSLAKASPAELGAIARDSGGAVPLRGTLAWSDADRGWVADWELEAAASTFRWQRRGVSFDDAFRNAMAGALQALSGNGEPD